MKNIAKVFLFLTAFVLIFTSCENPANEDNENNGNKETAKRGTLFVYAGTASSLEIANDSRGYTFPDTFLNQSNEISITIKNTGDGTINLIGKPYINLDGATTVFSVSAQPESSTISPGKSVSFKIKFSPVNATESYVYVSIPNDSENEPDFSFMVYGTGIRPKPIASIFYGNAEKLQNETIDASDVLFTQSTDITVIIKNTGQLPLEIETANISITSTDADAFTIISRPNASIQPESQSLFTIKCKPAKLGENRAVLTILTNDASRNQVVVNLRVNGVKGTPIPVLTQGTNTITDNTLTPVDFGRAEISSYNSLMFTIKNTGNIALELTGNPVIESSNAVFAISSQPANKTIDPNGSVSFMIRFTPSAEGEVTGKITIANNTDTGEFIFPVKGNGYEKKPQINIQQGTSTIALHSDYDFGTIASGKIKDIIFTVKNSGDANLNFITENNNRINITDNTSGFFTITQQPSASTVLTPENTTTFTVRFSPTTIGANFTATVRIKTNSRNNDDFSFVVKGTSRAANTEARLSGLQFSTGTLNPQFNSGIYTYELRIQTGPTLINVRPTSMDTNITDIKVNGISQGSGVLSQDIILASTNTVTIKVTAENGIATATYTINLKIVKTWEKLYGASGKRYGVFRAISNGEGGIYAGGYTSNSTAALFNFDQNGNLTNTFTFSSYNETIGPRGIGYAYNDYFSVYQDPYSENYYITKTTSPANSPTTILCSLQINNKKMYLYPKDIVKSNNYYFVAGNTDYYATTSATTTTYGVFINRHLSINGNFDVGRTVSLSISGITANTYEVYGMTVLTNGDILIYGEAKKSGKSVAFAAAVNVSTTSSDIRWSNIYEITNKETYFNNCFWDNSSNIILLGETDDGGFVVKFPGSTTTAAAAKPAGWPKVVTGTNAGFFTGLATTDGSGYIFVGNASGSHGEGDIWVVKTNTDASKIWEKYFGGTGNDYADAIVEQTDGFIIAGSTISPVISGQSRTGNEDIYILKINKDGTLD